MQDVEKVLDNRVINIILYVLTKHKIYDVCKYLYICINAYTEGLLTCITLYLSAFLQRYNAANILLGRPAFQSSDYGSRIATRAVNGDIR